MSAHFEVLDRFQVIAFFLNDIEHIWHLWVTKNLKDISPFCGATDTLFWTTGDMPCVSKPERIPCFHASSPAYNVFLRLTSSATPIRYISYILFSGVNYTYLPLFI